MLSRSTGDDATGFNTAPLRLTIDLGAIRDNWLSLKALSAPAETGAAVKSDAYGLGAAKVGAALHAAGCRTFFVATPAEGASLRPHVGESRIFVLSGAWPGMEAYFNDHLLIPTLVSRDQLAFWQKAMPGRDHALFVDTGMNRLGLTVEEAIEVAKSGIRPVMLLSHLACADRSSHPLNRQQVESFESVRRHFEGVDSSLSNSAGLFLGADYRMDLTRPGIALYGGACRTDDVNPMRPVVRAEARLIQIRQGRAGETVSYGASHRLERDTLIGIASIGYGDGYLRSLSGSGIPLRDDKSAGAEAEIAGRRVRVIGRVTMDLTMFDLTPVADLGVKTGDYLPLFGGEVSLDETAAAGTIGYEMLTALGPRFQRRYLGG